MIIQNICSKCDGEFYWDTSKYDDMPGFCPFCGEMLYCEEEEVKI